MFKRFSDADKWRKAWFRKLTPAEKCAWDFITSECDNVGVWDADTEAADYMIGEVIDWQVFREKCNGNIFIMPNGKWWLVDFCRFQYPELSEATTSRPLLSYIALLKKHTLWIPYIKGIDTVQDKDKDYISISPKNSLQEREENLGEAPHYLDTSSPLGEGAWRIDAARAVWNEAKAGPECRLLAITFKSEDREDCLRVMTAYSDVEIAEAIHTYAQIRASPEHEVSAPYRSLVGFIRGGVEKFVSSADPWSAYKRRLGNSFRDQEERDREAALAMLGET